MAYLPALSAQPFSKPAASLGITSHVSGSLQGPLVLRSCITSCMLSHVALGGTSLLKRPPAPPCPDNVPSLHPTGADWLHPCLQHSLRALTRSAFFAGYAPHKMLEARLLPAFKAVRGPRKICCASGYRARSFCGSIATTRQGLKFG